MNEEKNQNPSTYFIQYTEMNGKVRKKLLDFTVKTSSIYFQ